MSQRKDLTGQRFGRLTVLHAVEDRIDKNGKHHTRWLCQCDCGKQKIIDTSHLGSSPTSTHSCGCLQREKAIEANRKPIDYNIQGSMVYIKNIKDDKTVIIDLDDLHSIEFATIGITKRGDCEIYRNGKKIKLHRFLLHIEDALSNIIIDHINHNPLDNRKENLRICSLQQNNQNLSKQSECISKYKGVSINAHNKQKP